MRRSCLASHLSVVEALVRRLLARRADVLAALQHAPRVLGPPRARPFVAVDVGAPLHALTLSRMPANNTTSPTTRAQRHEPSIGGSAAAQLGGGSLPHPDLAPLFEWRWRTCQGANSPACTWRRRRAGGTAARACRRRTHTNRRAAHARARRRVCKRRRAAREQGWARC
jgi:hypothetical protein